MNIVFCRKLVKHPLEPGDQPEWITGDTYVIDGGAGVMGGSVA
jgi:hypothetical protein